MKIKLFFQIILLIGVHFLLQGQTTISGKIMDSDGPMIGVTIYVSDYEIGTISDFDGQFGLTTDHDLAGKTITFSFIGYQDHMETLTGQNQVLNIQMYQDATGLDEIVVIGSSITQSRKKLGNAITTLKSTKLLESTPANVTSSLQGRVPGAQITQNSGDPAGGFSIRLRGPSTIQGSSEPLYVLDGVVISNLTTNVTNLNVPAGDAAPGQNRLVDINPNDIESINILNGAAAAAIYGSRASNGVVLLSTFKGNDLVEDKPQFKFKTSISVNELRKKIDVNTLGEEFETVPNSPLSGRLWPIFGFNPQDLSLATFRYLSSDKFSTTRYDYQDDIFRTSLSTDNHLSVRGKSGTFKYFGSLGYTNNNGIIKNTNYERVNARLNLSQDITDWLSYDLGLYYIHSDTEEKPDGNVFWSPINSFNITNNVYDLNRRDSNGNLLAVENTRVNPLSIIETFDINQNINRFIPNLRLKAKPTKDITIDQIFGLDTYSQEGHIFIPVYPYENVNPAYFNDGYLGTANADVLNWNYDINVTYNKDLNDRINTSTTAGYSFQASKLDFEGEQGRGLDDNGNASIALQTQPINSRLDIYGVFLQETFSFDDKFYLTLAGRIDGATNFDVDQRNKFYPKVSGSYVVKRGGNDDPILNALRLRASYGVAGNLTAIAPFERFGSYNSIDFRGTTTFQQNQRLGNENLKPERTKEFEIGGDVSLFQNRVNILASYYRQKVEDLIVNRVLAPSVGGSSRTENVGSMQNNGFEAYVDLTMVKTNDLDIGFNLNFTTNKNKVLQTIGGDITVANVAGANSIVREGEPLGVFYGTYFATKSDGSHLLVENAGEGFANGVPQQERGDVTTNTVMRDSDGQPVGDPLRRVIGDPNPDYILGFGTDIDYKNFSFSLLFEAVQGFDVFDADKRTRQGVGLGTLARQELTGELPRGYIASIYPIEEFRMEDGSFVKMREIVFKYSIPSLSNKIGNIDISLAGRNLFSFDSFFSYDPETNAGGQSNLLRAVNFGNVPIPRTYTLSVGINF